VYAVSLPSSMEQEFQDIFYFIAIFQIIVALLLICSVLLYVKRIMQFNNRYGRFAMLLGIIFILANVMAASMNFYLGSGGVNGIMKIKLDNVAVWTIIFVPYYLFTEYIPAIAFAIVMDKYNEIF
jgi:hypothetical protein